VEKTEVWHPLSELLIQRLGDRAGARVLEFASGSGRNVRALQRAGFDVVAIDDAIAASSQPFRGITGTFAGAISTHGLLHGTKLAVAENLESIANLLERSGVLAASFGSTGDARFGKGERIDDSTFAPDEGEERGVAHAYFDRESLRSLLKKRFDIELMQEQTVDEIAGKWAHPERPLQAAVHWFVVACKR
jgi:hypothetical protein